MTLVGSCIEAPKPIEDAGQAREQKRNEARDCAQEKRRCNDMGDDLFKMCGRSWFVCHSFLKIYVSRLDEPVADRVAHDCRRRLELELSHEGSAMRLDRLDAQAERFAHLLVAFSLGNQLHDHPLAG